MLISSAASLHIVTRGFMDQMCPSVRALSFGDFFILESSMATKFFWAQADIQASLKEPIGRGELLPEKPIMMETSSGTQAADFIWNSHVLLVASKRTIGLLNREGFAGWGTYPVRIKTPSGFLEGYRGISVH